uniref:Pleckstrin-like plant domain-containing protein n=1 Tax=Aegilops tauschii TaxID=37682 RepID=M8CEJ2_AEGTA
MGSSNSSSFSDELPAVEHGKEQLPRHLLPRPARPRHRAPQAHPQRIVALEGRISVHQPDGRGDAEDEEQACRRDHNQEEEEDLAAWPGRHLLEGGEHRRYFGLRTAEHRVIEFECASQREHDMWTKGVARLLAIVDGRKRFA